MPGVDRRDFLRQLSAGAGVVALAPVYGTMRALAGENARMKITAVEPYLLPGGKCFVLVRTSEGVQGDTAQELSHGAMKSRLHSLFRNPLEFKDGRIQVPTGPGLGLELDEAQLMKMKQ